MDHTAISSTRLDVWVESLKNRVPFFILSRILLKNNALEGKKEKQEGDGKWKEEEKDKENKPTSWSLNSANSQKCLLGF